MVFKANKILVTGTDGFIGSHLTETLVNREFDVRAFVYYNSFNSYRTIFFYPFFNKFIWKQIFSSVYSNFKIY